MKLLAHTAAFR